MIAARDQWNRIVTKAKSDDDFDRTAALARALAYVELALNAAGYERAANGGIGFRLKAVLAGSSSEIRDRVARAIEARNAAVHQNRVPPNRECLAHVGTLRDVWRALRRKFVTHDHAASIARQCLENRHITTVLLYGSLGRNSKEPADIDLLLLDDGELSSFLVGYGRTGLIAIDLVLDALKLATDSYRAAVASGWLDITLLNGRLFGNDRVYVRSVAAGHRDQLFFLNVANSIESFNPETGTWNGPKPQIFGRYNALRTQIDSEGLLSLRRRGRSEG